MPKILSQGPEMLKPASECVFTSISMFVDGSGLCAPEFHRVNWLDLFDPRVPLHTQKSQFCKKLVVKC